MKLVHLGGNRFEMMDDEGFHMVATEGEFKALAEKATAALNKPTPEKEPLFKSRKDK